ncbi:hypothetical protein GE09DRAFT_371859 [Coniochaeta sp. 2T2.1]|nr:hypothetical protein GE09DRAFT_371859 [Coniochaeta sp. 2T2.1]
MRLWGRMGAIFYSDEELGKKNDDHKPAVLPTIRSQSHWAPARPSPRKTLKRLGLALAIGVLVYLFVHNIPTDLPIRDHRHPLYKHGPGYDDPNNAFQALPLKKSNRPPPSRAGHEAGPPAPTYNGPVKFMELAESLHAISSTRGSFTHNKNILFTASSLKSAAALLPIACQMGSELRSYVHFALMSRSEIELEELRAINGVDVSCHVIFHDARPDYPAKSTDARLALAATRALYHINSYMHPQAVIVDASPIEHDYFLKATRLQARAMGVPVIDLPQDSHKHLAYMTKLDSSSLNAWNKFHVDILIHASPGASGSLIRLLKSLSAADYTSCAIPHLTIELPHDVEAPTQEFLRTFQWPPARAENPSNAKQLSLRHRIARWALNEEESSIRFLESFWPANPDDSHVLVLSPQTELSPQFYHYLRYSVLEYKYSSTAQIQAWDTRLMGISLDLPTNHLNDSLPFTPPTKLDAPPPFSEYDPTDGTPLPPPKPTDGPTPFLWQSPSSNAVLFLGQKWVELHGFVSRLTDIQHRLPADPSSFLSSKSVSKRHPSWLEHALRLSRARGYWTLYPGEDNLAVVHGELYQPPEEYEDELAAESGSEKAAGDGEGKEQKTLARELVVNKKGGRMLPPFKELPLLDWEGKLVGLDELDEGAAEYTTEFREAVGGCEDLKGVELLAKASAADLFCQKE